MNPGYSPLETILRDVDRTCRTSGGHELDFERATCRRCRLTFRTIDLCADEAPWGLGMRYEPEVPVSDFGLDGAIPLDAPEVPWAPLDDAAWSAQNRKINALLSGRAG